MQWQAFGVHFVAGELVSDNSVVVEGTAKLGRENEIVTTSRLEEQDLVVAVVVDLGGTKCNNGARTSWEHTWSVHYEFRLFAIDVTVTIILDAVNKRNSRQLV